jgi:hypothetical protein
MPTRTVYHFISCLVLITGFATTTLYAQQTPRVDSCSAYGSGAPITVRAKAKVVDANTGAPISGASVTITVSGKSTTATTDAAGNCSGGIAFPGLSDMDGTVVTICVTGTTTCCECVVGAGVAKKKGKGPGEVALVVFAVLAISWLGWKVYTKQLNVG